MVSYLEHFQTFPYQMVAITFQCPPQAPVCLAANGQTPPSVCSSESSELWQLLLRPFTATGLNVHKEGTRGHLGNIVFGLLVGAREIFGESWPKAVVFDLLSIGDSGGVTSYTPADLGWSAIDDIRLRLLVLGTNDPEHWSIIIISPTNVKSVLLCDGLKGGEHAKVQSLARKTLSDFCNRSNLPWRNIIDAIVPTQKDN